MTWTHAKARKPRKQRPKTLYLDGISVQEESFRAEANAFGYLWLRPGWTSQYCIRKSFAEANDFGRAGFHAGLARSALNIDWPAWKPAPHFGCGFAAP